MAEAHAAGIAPDQFWHSTYREIYAAISGDTIRRRRDKQTAMWAAWHGANFERAKKMPSLGPILAKMEPKREMSNRDLRAAVIGMAHAMNAKVTIRKRGNA